MPTTASQDLLFHYLTLLNSSIFVIKINGYILSRLHLMLLYDAKKCHIILSPYILQTRITVSSKMLIKLSFRHIYVLKCCSVVVNL